MLRRMSTREKRAYQRATPDYAPGGRLEGQPRQGLQEERINPHYAKLHPDEAALWRGILALQEARHAKKEAWNAQRSERRAARNAQRAARAAEALERTPLKQAQNRAKTRRTRAARARRAAQVAQRVSVREKG